MQAEQYFVAKGTRSNIIVLFRLLNVRHFPIGYSLTKSNWIHRNINWKPICGVRLCNGCFAIYHYKKWVLHCFHAIVLWHTMTDQIIMFSLLFLNTYILIDLFEHSFNFPRGRLHGVMVKALDCGIVVREFVLQSCYYVHFRANTLGKGMNPLILLAMG